MHIAVQYLCQTGCGWPNFCMPMFMSLSIYTMGLLSAVWAGKYGTICCICYKSTLGQVGWRSCHNLYVILILWISRLRSCTIFRSVTYDCTNDSGWLTCLQSLNLPTYKPPHTMTIPYCAVGTCDRMCRYHPLSVSLFTVALFWYCVRQIV